MRLALALVLCLAAAACGDEFNGQLVFRACPAVIDDVWCRTVHPNDYCALTTGTLLVTHCDRADASVDDAAAADH